MRIVFMYDCHLFGKVPDLTHPRSAIKQRILDLFAEDGCGCVFSKDVHGRTTHDLHGHQLSKDPHDWGVTGQEVDTFLDKSEELFNLDCRS